MFDFKFADIDTPFEKELRASVELFQAVLNADLSKFLEVIKNIKDGTLDQKYFIQQFINMALHRWDNRYTYYAMLSEILTQINKKPEYLREFHEGWRFENDLNCYNLARSAHPLVKMQDVIKIMELSLIPYKMADDYIWADDLEFLKSHINEDNLYQYFIFSLHNSSKECFKWITSNYRIRYHTIQPHILIQVSKTGNLEKFKFIEEKFMLVNREVYIQSLEAAIEKFRFDIIEYLIEKVGLQVTFTNDYKLFNIPIIFRYIEMLDFQNKDDQETAISLAGKCLESKQYPALDYILGKSYNSKFNILKFIREKLENSKDLLNFIMNQNTKKYEAIISFYQQNP